MVFTDQKLIFQQEKCWTYLIEKFPEQTASFTSSQAELCQQAVTLSDFVYESFFKFPDEIFALFQSEKPLFEQTPDYSNALAILLKDCDTETELHRCLRLYRQQEMVRLAVADMLQNLTLTQSLQYLSKLADALILAALHWLSEACYQKWGRPQNSAGETLPLLVFGMGKLGGKELNFSSDIDLIFCYPERGETAGVRRPIDNQQFFTRLGQKLIAALDKTTEHGFVYRVDMRLRPFGESGPLVMNFNAIEDYYQEQGRDWERYAMLKARLIGDSCYHHQLQALVRPFVYRRYIDFSVIDSLRKMKMMIAQEVRRKQLVNNIKLGAGGIREIEFIVQVFQMIRGGQSPSLQQRNLLTVLPLLLAQGELDEVSYQALNSAYLFLRRLENLIQAQADQQTQTLPTNALDQQRLVTVLAYQTWDELLTDTQRHMASVHQVFATIIGEESPNHEAHDEHWQSLLIAMWPAAECEQYIEQHVPKWSGEAVWRLIVEFQQTVNKRTIGPRGRQVLDKLMPLILWHLEQAASSISVIERIFHIVTCVATRTAYLELLFENEGALKHLIKLCHASSWLAEHIAKYPILLDELIDPALLHNPPALSHYQDDLRVLMLRVPEDDLEMQMNALRQFKQAQQLRIAAADISGVLPLMKVSDHLTALAEAILAEVIHIAWGQVTKRHGQPISLAGGDSKGFLVLGYGKVGGIELGYSSDLDLVFLHGVAQQELTNGDKPISAGHFYIKVAQKIQHIFNTNMASGILYELDLRLRPQGNSGLLVIHVDSYLKYLQNEAWTWEHQALVRARAIYGCEQLRQRFSDVRHQVLIEQRDSSELAKAVTDMRDKMRAHLDKTIDSDFDIKQGVGGLVDIEFLAQYLVLKNAQTQPEITQYSDNIRVFELLAENDIVTEGEANCLINHYCELRNQGHKLSLQSESALANRADFEESIKKTQAIYQRFLG